jgi:prepilin-type N-terminal cleavage/methylation domain-containing protein
MRVHAPRNRSGFTLIELLVVIGIIVVFATLIVAVAPAFGDRQRASRGASMLQSWLNLAKQRALRDRKQVGVRLPTGTSYITELLYIEAPDESLGGTVVVPAPPSGNASPNYSVVLLNTTAVITAGVNALLQPEDVILIPGFDPRRIVSISGSAPNYLLTLDQPLTNTPSMTSAYRLSRKARPIVGEQVLQMPKDVAIDISYDTSAAAGTIPSWYRMYPPQANTGGSNPFDILFSPAGQVIGPEGSLGSRICLWVRDVSYPANNPTQMPPGYNTLITVYTRTGHVTGHEVDPTGLTLGPNWNPFRFTQDGLSSGF